MIDLVSRRFIGALATLFAASILYFAAIELLPGDFASATLGQRASAWELDEIRETRGLYRPVHVRYLDWLSHIVSGDFGRSWGGGYEIAELLKPRLFNTLVLALATATVAIPAGILLGLLAARRRNSRLDRVISSVSLTALSIPEFVIGYLVVFLFAVSLPLAPAISVVSQSTGLAERLYAIVLPVLTLSLVSIPSIVRLTRAALLNVLSQPFVEMAVLKGLEQRRIFWHHVLLHALAPIINVVNAWFRFDNSSRNPYNPRVPPARVRWGWGSDQEMCELWMRFAADDTDALDRVKNAGNRTWRRGADLKAPPP